MKNWTQLDDIQYKTVWDYIYDKLNFQPYADKTKVSSLDRECLCYDLSGFFNEGYQQSLYDDLHKSFLEIFKTKFSGQKMIALDWNHDCYVFNPNLSFEKNAFGEWLIPLFPNGDLVFFLSEDFANIIFGDGINLTFNIFGETLINAINLNKPKILTTTC